MYISTHDDALIQLLIKRVYYISLYIYISRVHHVAFTQREFISEAHVMLKMEFNLRYSELQFVCF